MYDLYHGDSSKKKKYTEFDYLHYLRRYRNGQSLVKHCIPE